MNAVKTLRSPLARSAAALLLIGGAGLADDWTTVGADAQRSGWIRADRKISVASVAGPEFQLLWRIPTSSEARSGHGLTVPVLLDFLISHRGFRSLAFVGGASGGVHAMDTDLARMEWERQFAQGSSDTTSQCPGGMTASLSRTTSFAMPSMLGIGARGRRTPAKSGVGGPGEGAVTLASLEPPRPFTRAPSPSEGRTRPPASPALRGVTLVYALPASGELHALYVSNGRDHVSPVPFLPPNANARGLTVSDDTAFVVTANRCGGVADGVWSLDLETRVVRVWESDGGSIAGSAGMAFDPNGTVYAATRDGALVALERRSMNPKLRSPEHGFRSSPVVFDVGGDDHLAAITAGGAILVYAASNLSKPVATAELGTGSGEGESALATWRDGDGTRWILAPAGDSVTAWKLSGDGGELSLERGWEHGGLASVQPPIVVNGVAFIVDGGSGEASARLHALNATTGQHLWDSGDSIRATASGHVLSAGPGHVYLTALDSAVYSFGLPMEH